MDNENSNNIESPLIALEKLTAFHFSYENNAKLKKCIENPMQYYVDEILPKRISNIEKRNYIATKLLNNSENELNKEITKSKFERIYEKIKNGSSFNTLKISEIKCIIRYATFWIDDDYSTLWQNLIRFLSVFEQRKRLYKDLLKLYFTKYLTIKNDKNFMQLFSKIHNEYISNDNEILFSIKQIFNDCNILNNDFTKELAIACLSEQRESPDNILEIIKKRYNHKITSSMDVYSEIIREIGSICMNNLQDRFYFNLLFDEVLNSQITKYQSARLVVEIIKYYTKTNVSQQILNEVKSALFRNENYGDPRIQEIRSYWSSVKMLDENMYHVFITWIAQADLEFFFKLIFKDKQDEHHRKEFWQQYIKSPNLIGSEVIFGAHLARSNEVIDEEKKNKTKYPKFLSDDRSCFILKFNTLYIVEASDTSNAVYIYTKDEAPNMVKHTERIPYNGSVDDLKDRNVATQYSNQNKGIVPNRSVWIKHHGHKNVKNFWDRKKSWEELAEEVLEKFHISKNRG